VDVKVELYYWEPFLSRRTNKKYHGHVALRVKLKKVKMKGFLRIPLNLSTLVIRLQKIHLYVYLVDSGFLKKPIK
jgi:hypothetical protein